MTVVVLMVFITIFAERVRCCKGGLQGLEVTSAVARGCEGKSSMYVSSSVRSVFPNPLCMHMY